MVRGEGVTGDSHGRSMQAAQADELIRLLRRGRAETTSNPASFRTLQR